MTKKTRESEREREKERERESEREREREKERERESETCSSVITRADVSRSILTITDCTDLYTLSLVTLRLSTELKLSGICSVKTSYSTCSPGRTRST